MEGLRKALAIISGVRGSSTPVGIVRNATRRAERRCRDISALSRPLLMIDMLTILIVGNSSTFVSDGVIITPRG